MPWDRQTVNDETHSTRDGYSRNSRDNSNRDSRDSQRMRIERLGIGSLHHTRNDSGNASSTDYSHEQNGHSRKHDYDIHSMETSVQGTPQLKDAKNSIPLPVVTVRSEFPTLNRSRQQQALTCLVTIEVPEGKWHSHFDELQNAPPMPPMPTDVSIAPSGRSRQQQPLPYESPEVLDEITEELRVRVDNWHGLEFQRFVTAKTACLATKKLIVL